jgi:hypothetical protein
MMMTSSPRTRGTALLAAALALTACTKGGREDYVKDADTGAAAPATVQTVNSPTTPDSTAGVSRRTGVPQAAGDTNASGVNKGTIQSNDNTRSVPGAATGAPTTPAPRTP